MVKDNAWLTRQVAEKRIMPARFGGKTWLLDAAGTAYLPEADWLVVSDLHLEKGSYLRCYGNPVPQLDSQATLHRLSRIINDYQPEVVICLGDSFHDTDSVSRMQDADKALLASLIRQVPRWCWVLGNHDPAIPESVGGERHARLLQDTVGLCHEPEAHWPAAEYQLIGHFHPKARIRQGRHVYRGKSFLIGQKLMIMPAFGQYTGGLWIDDEVVTSLIPVNSRQAFMLYDHCIVRQT